MALLSEVTPGPFNLDVNLRERRIANLDEFIDFHLLRDYDVPWWAVALLELPDYDEKRVRNMMLRGFNPRIRSVAFWEVWARIVKKARTTVCQKTIAEWRELAYNDTDKSNDEGGGIAQRVRKAALCSSRSFVEWVGLKDPDGKQIHLKYFHVKSIDTLRHTPNTVVLLPLEHGKSWISSIPIPLMDWAEWADCSEARVYLEDDIRAKQVLLLKQEIEYNDDLHRLFPWVRKPRRGDVSRVWNETSFSIGGRSRADPAFRAFKIRAGRIGHRAHRTIIDDVVTTMTAESVRMMDTNWEWINAGAKTFPETTTRASIYGTTFPTFGVVGTLFTPIDTNMRAWEHFRELHRQEPSRYRCRRYDIFPRGREHPEIVLWPEHKTPKQVEEMRLDMGPRAFDMRCRNLIRIDGRSTFPEVHVRQAEHDGQDGKPYAYFGVPPRGARLAIGIDPGTGRITRDSKNPAISLYGMREVGGLSPDSLGMLADNVGLVPAASTTMHHIIKWRRMSGYSMPQQCDLAIEWAREHLCPIFVEDNQTQASWADLIAEKAPDVIVECHHTGDNKRDPKAGIEQFQPLFANRLMVIHAADAPPDELTALRREWTTFPGRFTDLVMSIWVARYSMHLRERVDNLPPPTRYAPSYVRQQSQVGRGRYLVNIPE